MTSFQEWIQGILLGGVGAGRLTACNLSSFRISPSARGSLRFSDEVNYQGIYPYSLFLSENVF